MSPRLTADQDYNIKAVIIDKAGNSAEMASGVDLRIEPSASILPPLPGADLDVEDQVTYFYHQGAFSRDTVHTLKNGVQMISTGGTSNPRGDSTYVRGSESLADIYRPTPGNILLSAGSKTELHVNEVENVKLFFNGIPAGGDVWISYFDSEGAFIGRHVANEFRLYQGHHINAPIGKYLGKIVIEVPFTAVEPLKLFAVTFDNTVTHELVSDGSALLPVTEGSEDFSSFANRTYAAGETIDFSNGLKIVSGGDMSITDNELRFETSRVVVSYIDFGAVDYVEFKAVIHANFRHVGKIFIYDTAGNLIQERSVPVQGKVRIDAPEGIQIGKIGFQGQHTRIDDLIWGEADTSQTPPTDIVVRNNVTEFHETFDTHTTLRGKKLYLSNGLLLDKSNVNSADSYDSRRGMLGALRVVTGEYGENLDRKLILNFGKASHISIEQWNEHFQSAYPFGPGNFIIYDTEGNLLTTIRGASSGRNIIEYTAPEGVLIGEVHVTHYQGYLDNIKWKIPSASSLISTFGAEEMTLNDELVHLSNMKEGEEETIIGTEGRIDILAVQGEDQLIDLTRLGEMVKSVEVIDLTGSGNNTLNISLGDILAQGGTNLFINDDTTQMMVKGNEGDVLNLSDLVEGADTGDWAKVEGTVQVSGVRYEVYKHSSLEAELLVQEGIQTNLLNN